MPILHSINEELGLVISSWVGEISDADLLPSYKKLYENKIWKPGFNEIVDVRNAQVKSVTSKGLLQLSDLVKSYVKEKGIEFKTAIIAPEDLQFGLSRVYEAISHESPEKIMVFRDLNDAFDWLDIDIKKD